MHSLLVKTDLERSDSLGFATIILRILILLTLGVSSLLVLHLNIIFFFLVYYLYCTVWNFSSWAGIGHELAHRTVFKRRSFNNLVLVLFSYLTL